MANLERDEWDAAEAPPAPVAAPAHDAYAVFRLREYRLLWAATLASFVGQQIQGVAVGWEIFQRTGSAMALGWVGLVQALPVILLALPAGHLADQRDRRNIFMCSQTLAAACSLGLAALSYTHGPVGFMYLLLLIGATALAMGWPARSALVPQIVPQATLSQAMMWNSSGFQVAAVAGPALGGAILLASVPAAYVADAVCGVVCIALLARIGGSRPVPVRQAATVRTLVAGLHFVWLTKPILATITLDLFAVLLGGAVYLLPIFAKDILHVGSVGFGWLRAAPAVGALGMAMLLAHRPPMRRAGPAMLLAVAGFGAATIVFGLSRSFALSMLMLLLTGALDNISVVVRHTLVQLLTPDEMRGRVSAVNNVFIGASNELGGFESGLTAALMGPVASVVLGGVGTVAVVGAVALIWPQIRRIRTLDQAGVTDPSPASAAPELAAP